MTDASASLAPSPAPASRRGRAVLLVDNEANPYSRGLRVARSLAADGWQVEIAAVGDGRLPSEERDSTDPSIVIRRYEPSGPWARWSVGREAAGARPRMGRRSLRERLRRVPGLALRLVAWPIQARGWWATLRRELPPADLYHAFGILAIPVALALAADARGRGRHPVVVYDVIDVILESNNVARVPRPFLAWYRRREAGWVRHADAVVTVNDAIADHLARTWPVRRRPTVLLNCQPRWDAPGTRPDLIRSVTGIPPERRIVLFLGRLGRERGLEEASEAVLRLDDAALVLLGFGPWAERLHERDDDPRLRGHHFTLPAVHPDDVPGWTASADVSIVAVPANSLNQRLSSPNKFWESLAAGTPVVVGRDLVVMRGIVEQEGLGAVGDPADPADLARALREVLDLPRGDYEAMRARCLAVTHDRYNWEAAVGPYLDLVRGLTSRDADVSG